MGSILRALMAIDPAYLLMDKVGYNNKEVGWKKTHFDPGWVWEYRKSFGPIAIARIRCTTCNSGTEY